MEVIQAVEITDEEAKEFKEKQRKAEENLVAPAGEIAKEKVEVIQTEEDARNLITKVKDYVESGRFKQKVEALSERTNIPEKKIARSFVEKVLGTIGDKGEVVGETIEDIVKTFLNVLNYILSLAVELVMKAARFLLRLVTFNFTAAAT